MPNLLYGSAVDINDRDDVIGDYFVFDGEATHGFLWSRRDGFIDLGSEFVPIAINNRRQIAGVCHGAPGEEFDDAVACVWEDGSIRSLDIVAGYWR